MRQLNQISNDKRFYRQDRPRTVWALLVSFVCIHITSAQTYRTWDDGKSDSDDWSEKNNWSNNNKPSNANEVARFSNGNESTTSIEINSNQRTGGHRVFMKESVWRWQRRRPGGRGFRPWRR